VAPRSMDHHQLMTLYFWRGAVLGSSASSLSLSLLSVFSSPPLLSSRAQGARAAFIF